MLILIRGIPGSGKTTVAKKAKQLLENAGQSVAHFEADMFFTKDGVYNFDPSKLKEAHEWCFASVEAALSQYDHVIVSNTFSRYWEMSKYLKLPITKKVIRCIGEYENIHGVPIEAVNRMKERFEDYNGEELYK